MKVKELMNIAFLFELQIGFFYATAKTPRAQRKRKERIVCK
jgi:hypothetical protein